MVEIETEAQETDWQRERERDVLKHCSRVNMYPIWHLELQANVLIGHKWIIAAP